VSEERPAPTGGELDQAIAEAVVRSHTRTVGRGPTKAQAFHRQNIFVVVMSDTLTRGELSLVAAGNHESVQRLRTEFQRAMHDELVSQIEVLTGCKVVAFMSATHTDPDVAADLFVLDRPVTGDSELGLPTA
jgi:uncharacterized protein YbcI